MSKSWAGRSFAWPGDEALRQDLARKGRERAAEFTWEAAVESTWNVYRELR
jgi:glycosyltransferase involved in cell wall biosynthesis